MGLLDDAIREHLDLKRRRGADPTEIERAEREALGPVVRRGPELTEEEVAAPEHAGAVEPEYAEHEGEQWEPFHEDPELHDLEEPDELAPYEHPRAPDGDPLMDDEPLAEEPYESEPADFAPPHQAEPPVVPAPAPHPADPPSAPDPRERSTHIDQETEEYELEPEGEEGEAGDDMLESTPEFLQDAPEHDRLWFEQRPPRDFDFDG